MPPSHSLKNFFWYHLPLLVWMAGIFVLSAMPGSGMAHEMPTRLYMERKGAHVFEYAVLTALVLRLFRIRFAMRDHVAVLAAALLSLAYAVSDEFHQHFVFGREGKPSDVAIDSIGITLALLAFAWWRPRSVSRAVSRAK
jgi:VanZ family protein